MGNLVCFTGMFWVMFCKHRFILTMVLVCTQSSMFYRYVLSHVLKTFAHVIFVLVCGFAHVNIVLVCGKSGMYYWYVLDHILRTLVWLTTVLVCKKFSMFYSSVWGYFLRTVARINHCVGLSDIQLVHWWHDVSSRSTLRATGSNGSCLNSRVYVSVGSWRGS